MKASETLKAERVREQLRQEREAFALKTRWYSLCLVMGVMSLIILVGLTVICAIVIFKPDQFPDFIVNISGSALFLDVLGLMCAIWKLVFKNPLKLTPETKESYSDDAGDSPDDSQ